MATDPSRGHTSATFDRVGRTSRSGHDQDAAGKEALFSTAPSSAPPRPFEVTCPRCHVPTALGLGAGLTLFRPPFLLDPFGGRLWSRCPHCGERAWLDLGFGQALQALLGRPRG